MGERELDLSGSGEGQWTFVNTLLRKFIVWLSNK